MLDIYNRSVYIKSMHVGRSKSNIVICLLCIIFFFFFLYICKYVWMYLYMFLRRYFYHSLGTLLHVLFGSNSGSMTLTD